MGQINISQRLSRLLSHSWCYTDPRHPAPPWGICEGLRGQSPREAQVGTCPKGCGGTEAPGQLRNSSGAGWADGSLPFCTTGDYVLCKTKAALNSAPCVAAKTELLPKFQWENSLLSFFETSRPLIFWYSRLKISTLATEGTDCNENRKYLHARDNVVWFLAFGVKSLTFSLAFWVYLICWQYEARKYN